MADNDISGQATSYAPSSTPGGLQPGTLLNGIYRIEERLGAGGMGEVYRATNIANEDQDAIKIIGRGMANQTVVEAMFRKEARVLRRIQSPAVAQLRLFARDPELDVLYFVTEFVAGVSLLDRLKQRPGNPEEVRALMARMAIGLQAVHDAGAIHRDLSPDNIILPDGDVTQAKIIDFGIVKELDPTQVSMIGDGFAGKFGYIAPEQLGFTGSRVGPWTDLYALALVGIAFAAGKPLYMGATMGTADEARRKEIDLSALAPEMRPVFARMLTYDWRERASSASALLAMLDVADGETQVNAVAPPPPPAPPPAPPPPPPPPPVYPTPSHPPQSAWPQGGAPQDPSWPPPQAQPGWGHGDPSQPPYGAQPGWSGPGASQPPAGANPYQTGNWQQPSYPPQQNWQPPQQFAGGHEYSQPPVYPKSGGAKWPIFVGLGVLLLLVVGVATYFLTRPLPFAAPGVPTQDTSSGLQYQVLAPGQGGAHPSPGDTVILRVRQHHDGESAAEAGTVVVDTLTADRMWAGEIEAIKLMSKGQRLLVWIPSTLRGPIAGRTDSTPAGERAVRDIELIDFGAADSPTLQARIAELTQPAATPTPLPSDTPTPQASPTDDQNPIDYPDTQPTVAPAPAPAPTYSPPPAAPPVVRSESVSRRRPPARPPVQTEDSAPRQRPSNDGDGDSVSVGKGRTG